ncbi:MAG: rRNA methyltransferase [Gemmatimonadetes bacterium]|nr:rRNA methyltransferase [Gemmatimonadota bacterium]
MAMSTIPPHATLAERFHLARRDPELAVLEGLHALKHGYRFGAELLEVVVRDLAAVSALAERVAPDVLPVLRHAQSVGDVDFAALAPVTHATGVIALARRLLVDAARSFAAAGTGAIVLLERPTQPANIGAAVRVAAAAGAAGLFTLGGEDPWRPAALRGGAGLQYALPVARIEVLPPTDRPLVALDPEGDPLGAVPLPPRCVLVFGSERAGISGSLLARAAARVRIPMRAGVSSLNLATAVAVVLYALEGTAAR